MFWYWSRLDSVFGAQEIRCLHASFHSIHSLLNIIYTHIISDCIVVSVQLFIEQFELGV